jgi:hypothetical protein
VRRNEPANFQAVRPTSITVSVGRVLPAGSPHTGFRTSIDQDHDTDFGLCLCNASAAFWSLSNFVKLSIPPLE